MEHWEDEIMMACWTSEVPSDQSYVDYERHAEAMNGFITDMYWPTFQRGCHTELNIYWLHHIAFGSNSV